MFYYPSWQTKCTTFAAVSNTCFGITQNIRAQFQCKDRLIIYKYSHDKDRLIYIIEIFILVMYDDIVILKRPQEHKTNPKS